MTQFFYLIKILRKLGLKHLKKKIKHIKKL